MVFRPYLVFFYAPFCAANLLINVNI